MPGNQTATLPKPTGFSLAESQRFLTGFRAIAGTGEDASLDLAFALDSTWEPVGVHVSEQEDAIVVEALSNPEGASAEAIGQNVARILSLTIDGTGYAAIARRDPIVGTLQKERPGLRPVLFPTAWEAAVWAILSQRTRRTQAVAIKQRLSEALGNAVAAPNGITLHGFPGPTAIIGLDEIRGVSLQKMQWLRSLSEGALRGQLDCAELAVLPQDEGMKAVRTLPGIGPFSAELILARGAGNPDIFPLNEPMLHEKMTRLYGADSMERHREIAENWRPFRSWVSLLIRTSEVAGPGGLRPERLSQKSVSKLLDRSTRSSPCGYAKPSRSHYPQPRSDSRRVFWSPGSYGIVGRRIRLLRQPPET